MVCYVYFIQKEDQPNSPIKVGMSGDVQGRLRTLQTASPAKLAIKAAIRCESKKEARKLERSIHYIAQKRFKRLEGEWFLIQGSWKKLMEQAFKMSREDGVVLSRDELKAII